MKNTFVTVVGNVGGDEANQALGQRRAQAVVDYLVKKGVAADRLVAKGVGAQSPVADNTSEAGRRQNRRVEFHPID